MTITITTNDRKEILEGIASARTVINLQLNKLESQINYEIVNSYKKYINDMQIALETGQLNII